MCALDTVTCVRVTLHVTHSALFLHACAHKHAHTHTSTVTHTLTGTHTSTGTHTHTHTHTHAHAHTHILFFSQAQAVRPFIDPNTQKKIHFINAGPKEADDMNSR
jgi:2-polyprenyl-3-methyl-5-hydroxy-6-metoxy-1,4-benzoquinol methylase